MINFHLLIDQDFGNIKRKQFNHHCARFGKTVLANPRKTCTRKARRIQRENNLKTQILCEIDAFMLTLPTFRKIFLTACRDI